jgi:phosphosulfolactate phosphohydrolase-like enzyme
VRLEMVFGFTAAAVGGKTALICTTNGTVALTSVQGARDVVVARYVNSSAAASLIDRKYGDNVMRLFLASTHGRAVREAGLGADLPVCGSVDGFPVVPILHERQITRLGLARER